MFLLKKHIIKKLEVNKKTADQLKFEASKNNKKYKVESIYHYTVYIRKLKTGNLSGFYYLVLQNS